MYRIFACIPLLAVGAFAADTSTATAGAASQDEIEQARFVFAGYVAGRQKLRSAVCRVRNGQEEDTTSGSDYVMLFALDSAKGNSRFDHTFSSQLPDADGSLTTHTIRLPDRRIEFTRGLIESRRTSIKIKSPDQERKLTGQEFDVRVFGFDGYPLFGAQFQEVAEFFDSPVCESKIYRVTKHPDDLWEIERRSGFREHVKRVWWFDESKDFAIIRDSYFTVQVLTKTGPITHPEIPTHETETTWKNVNDVWVQDTMAYRNRIQQIDTGLVFDWEVVNQAVNDRVFSVEGLDAPNSTAVVDMRTGSPVSIGTVNSLTRTLPAGPTAQPTRWTRWLFVAFNGLIVGIIVFYLAVGRLKTSSRQ